MVHVLCADKVRTRPAIMSTSPLQSLSEAPMSPAQKRFAYLANTLIDAALGPGSVNKRGAFQNSSGTQTFLPTRSLTRYRTGSEDHSPYLRSKVVRLRTHAARVPETLIALALGNLD
jgi:hypothetical protein